MSIKANKDNAVFISNAYLQEDGYKASATVTFSTIPIDGQNITLNGTTFTYRTTPAVANDVAIGASISIAIDNLLTEALPAAATYTKVGTNQIFIEYGTIGTIGNSYTIASNFMTVPSSLSGGSDTPDADWVDNTPTVDYKLPEIVIENDSTSTALKSFTPVAENDPVKVYNSTDGLVEGSLGTTTTTTGTTSTHNIFGDGSCIATYTLDGNANDLGGNYNGTSTNVTYGTGKFGQAAVFNGTNAGIDLPNTATSSIVNQTSVSVWVKCTAQVGDNFIFNSRYSVVTHSFYVNTSGKLCSNNYNTNGNIISSGPSIGTNLWVHIVFVYNNGDWKYYVNKTLDSSLNRTFTAFAQTVSGGNTIGKLDTETNFFNGSIDQVRIFNRALTPTEVTTLYNEQVTKYTSDITILSLSNPPTKAWLDKPITVSTVTESTENRCIAQDETLSVVSSTLTEYVGTNTKSGLLATGDSIQLNGTTDVVCSNVVETDLGGGSYQYTCTIPSQASAPTSAKVLDRSVTSGEVSDTYDNVNEKFIKTYNKIEKQGRAFKYKLEADEGVEITKVNIEMNKQG